MAFRRSVRSATTTITEWSEIQLRSLIDHALAWWELVISRLDSGGVTFEETG